MCVMTMVNFCSDAAFIQIITLPQTDTHARGTSSKRPGAGVPDVVTEVASSAGSCQRWKTCQRNVQCYDEVQDGAASTPC